MPPLGSLAPQSDRSRKKAAPEIAREAIERVRALYAIEKQAADLTPAKLLEARQKQSAPTLAQLRDRLLIQHLQAPRYRSAALPHPAARQPAFGPHLPTR